MKRFKGMTRKQYACFESIAIGWRWTRFNPKTLRSLIDKGWVHTATTDLTNQVMGRVTISHQVVTHSIFVEWCSWVHAHGLEAGMELPVAKE